MSAKCRPRLLLSSLLLLVATSVAAAGYPAILAGEVALYPQARIDSVDEYAGGANVVLITAGTMEDAARYYREQLGGKGWTTSVDMALGKALALEFQRGAGNISINIMATPAGTTVVLTINQ